MEGDLVAIDINIWFEEQICYAVITVRNNDSNRTVTTNFWVQLRQDTHDGLYLGEVYVTEDLSPAEWYTTDPIAFYPQSGSHYLCTEVVWRRNVPETDENNNWHDELFWFKPVNT